ncbi:hypothetical protein [Methylobacterium tarhaniae]|uniref:hypothetical protein n=1 Tax=Methylobacterium tarhaniae TaxID=1187852 RepID=UPI000A8521B0|nr:hypothetical protein [Methylobacterium tarhaniae]
MAEPQDMIVPPLREMRAAFEQRFDMIDRTLDEQGARFDKLERRLADIEARG